MTNLILTRTLYGLSTANKVEDSLYYLASPYSSDNKDVMLQRYYAVEDAAVCLLHAGFHLIEPIASCHHKSLRYQLPGSYDFWQTRDRLLISRCDGIIVLTIDGWDRSVGVTDEIEFARSLDKPVLYLHPGPQGYYSLSSDPKLED